MLLNIAFYFPQKQRIAEVMRWDRTKQQKHLGNEFLGIAIPSFVLFRCKRNRFSIVTSTHISSFQNHYLSQRRRDDRHRPCWNICFLFHYYSVFPSAILRCEVTIKYFESWFLQFASPDSVLDKCWGRRQRMNLFFLLCDFLLDSLLFMSTSRVVTSSRK